MSFNIVDTQDYGVPQSRTRMILLGTHRRTAHKWVMPDTDPEVKTLADTIGDLPIVDPFIYDITEEEIYQKCVIEFISGMTDQFAIEVYEEIIQF